jgi:type I restriction enzyme R subunit
LFGDKQAGGIVLLKAYNDYYYVYNDGKKDIAGYHDLIHDLKEKFPIGKRIIGEESKIEFIKLYGTILKLKTY